jgi:hypothetical protein
MPMSDAGDTAELEKLAAELDGPAYAAWVVTVPGRRPYVHVRNRTAGALNENVYAGDGFYWWGWGERIAPVTEVGEAARLITRVLRAVGTQ